MDGLELQPASAAVLSQYQAWGKQVQAKYHRDLEYSSSAYAEGRLFDGQYGRAEVDSILKQHFQTLQTEVQKNHEHAVDSTSQLLKVLLCECDRHRVPITFDPQQLLHSVSGTQVSALELAEANVLARGGGVAGKRGLAPLSAADKGDQTAKQLQSAQDEIARLNEKCRNLQQAVSDAAAERSKAKESFLQVQDSVATYETELGHARAMNAEELQATIQRQQQQLQAQQAQVQEAERRAAGMGHELTQLQHDMQGRLAQSSQFQNLKRMMAEKNEQVRALRQALSRYDPSAAMGGDDDIEAADDDD